MATTSLNQKITHDKALATTIYFHTCKFTGKLFVSPNRRPTYSPEGLLLKKEYDEAIKTGRKQVCKVYFYLCPITGQWFTTRKASSRYSPESKAITKQKELAYARQHRQHPQVKEYEQQRRQRPERIAYRREWERNRTR